MHAVIQNFRGIKDAQIEIKPIALITGINGAGKTSIARAIAAAATGKAVPFDKLTKKDCAIMLRNGSKTGMVNFGSDEGSTTVEWPKADAQSDGRPPFSSDIAAGLTDLLSMKEKDALGYLITLLKAEVKKEDFLNALAEAGISAEAAAKIWLTVEAQGWEAAVARAKETGIKLKGVWENTSGEKFGSKKMDTWYPANWHDSLAQETPESLQAAIDEARRQLEDIIGRNAVIQAETATLRAQAESIDTLESQKTEASGLVQSLEADLKKVEEQLKESPNPDAKAEYSCPHCAGLIHISAVSGTQYMLTKAGKVDEKKLKEARLQHASLSGQQQNISIKLADARRKLQSITANSDAAWQAIEKLKAYENPAQASTQDELNAGRDTLAAAETRKKTFDCYTETKKIAAQIAANQGIIDLLDETGLRRTKLTQGLDAFKSSYIEPLCEAMGIEPVALDADLSIAVGKVSYQMLSASEQYRVRVILQLAIAQLERASITIIDGADILDQSGRGKLLQAVIKTGIPTIICMTLNKPDMAPNLAQAGVGISYWVSDGSCAPFAAPQPKSPISPSLHSSVQQPEPEAASQNGVLPAFFGKNAQIHGEART